MLNKLNLSKNRIERVFIAFIISLSLIGLSCGKRKPPLPPFEKIQQRVEIFGVQRGNIITLSWTLPEGNVSDKNILNIARADIYRLAEPLANSLSLSEEEFATKSTLIYSLPISEADFEKKEITYNDFLEFASQSVRLRYAIRFVNASGQKAAFSNFFFIEPTARIASQPISLDALILEEAIKLNWAAPNANVDGTKPANILGYNVYRVSNDEKLSKLLNSSPITDNKFEDKFFEFEKEYKYFVRTVSLGSNGEPVESLDSNNIEVKPKDIFAPSPPSAITIAAAPNNLSIFFAINVEKDVVGYKIYRSTNPIQKKSEWMLLTKELLSRNTFQDFAVESGITYYYYLVAQDKAGNKSEPSEIVTETAP